MKKALITGATGQDGSYLSEFLLDKGYEVHGTKRRSSSFNTSRIDHIMDGTYPNSENYYLHYADLTDGQSLSSLINNIKPDEVYNLGAQSHVSVSFELPEYTGEVDAIGTLKLLESIRSANLQDKVKFYQASTSELFGLVQEIPQKETTPFYPRSPYGVAKIYSYWMVVNYRESYGMHASNGILFNHESPRRGETFVTRKITRAVARIKHNKQEKLSLGNLNAKRDWGHAKDYVKMMWLMLQADHPDDYVIASGETHTVRKFTELAFKEIGIQIRWEGDNENEKGYCKDSGRLLVDVDSKYYRPAEVEILIGDATKAEKILKWKTTTSLNDLVKEMVESDLIIESK